MGGSDGTHCTHYHSCRDGIRGVLVNDWFFDTFTDQGESAEEKNPALTPIPLLMALALAIFVVLGMFGAVVYYLGVTA